MKKTKLFLNLKKYQRNKPEMQDLKNHVFLLGGPDLEMATIKQLLFEHVSPQQVMDKQLQWGARLSGYKDEFNEIDTFVGIELINDIAPPKNYINIDHHNEHSGNPTAMEQVAALLKVGLNRWQKLVAANDRAYIPGLLEMGATQEEIAKIRLADRKAQGVTPQDEKFAGQSIEQNMRTVKGVTIVKSLTPRFSPITDRLYRTEKLLVYTDNELTYYGKGAAGLAEHFNKLIQGTRLIQGKGKTVILGLLFNY